eukprot:NODE_327_length_10929_cov_0.344137.p5 type:complete len:137 gc:universal NODE_327_length_10929_cov_0.344137:1234-824(-)
MTPLKTKGGDWMLTHLLSNQNPFNTQESYFVSPSVETFQNMTSSINHSESDEDQTEIVESWVNESTRLGCCQKKCLQGKDVELTKFRINYSSWTSEQKNKRVPKQLSTALEERIRVIQLLDEKSCSDPHSDLLLFR